MASRQHFPVPDEAHVRNALSRVVGAEPVLTEHQAGVTIRWFCNPPPKGWVFRITREVWSTDYSVRDIYAWDRRSARASRSSRRLQVRRTVDCGDYQLLIEPYGPWQALT